MTPGGSARPSDLPLAELLEKLREDRVTLEEYFEDVLLRVEEREPVLQALLPEENRRERLFSAAESLRGRFIPGQRPPLYGALFGVKDIFKVDGFPMRAGSRLPEAAFEGPQAKIVSQLLELGAVPLGRTVTTEFAYFSPGPTTNPRDPGHTPGGSSSGSAAAVGAGYCRFALGTQTIGSIIRPASFCGIAGIKPSFGTLPTAGVFPFSQSADHVGFLLGNVSDASVLLGILLDGAPWEAASEPRAPGAGASGGGASLALPDEGYLSQVEPETLKQFQETIRSIEKAGVSVKGSSALSDIGEIAVAHREMIAREFYESHRRLFGEYADLYSEASTKLYLEGQGITEAEAAAAAAGRMQLRRLLDEELERLGARAWLSPSAFGTAPEGLLSTGSPAMNLPWTYAGLPAVNVPLGSDEKGLPYGLQVAGRFGEDRETVETAAYVEAALSPEA
jgi:Asp-tRNA(Asn)/Glu-tRNA(Gln) amidotransferase A subunit family amidase